MAEKKWGFAVQHPAKAISLAAFMVFAGCYAGARLDTFMVFPGIGTAVLFAPYAVLATALLLSQPRHTWIYITASALGNFWPHLQRHGITAFVLEVEVANILRAMVAAYGVRWLCGESEPFDTLRGMVAFVLFGVVLGPVAGAFVGASAVVMHNEQNYWVVWQAWLLSNMLTGLILLPLVLLACSRATWNLNRWAAARIVEAVILTIALLSVEAIIFAASHATNVSAAILYVPLPLLLWAAMRFGPTGMIAAQATLAMMTIVGAFRGHGPFVHESPSENLIQLQLFLIALCVPLLLLAALVQEQRENHFRLVSAKKTLREAYERSNELAQRLLTAQEEERTRIAGELHDDVSQQLAAMSIALSTLKRRLPQANPDALRDIDQLQKEAGQLAETIRLLSHELHPAMLQHIGIAAALRGRCFELQRKSGLIILVETNELGKLREEITVCLFRVAQECLHNVFKHARASKVCIRLQKNGKLVEMTVTDNGRGFDKSDPSHHRGMGFISMEERVRIVGGKLLVESSSTQAGGGTKIWVEVPQEQYDENTKNSSRR